MANGLPAMHTDFQTAVGLYQSGHLSEAASLCGGILERDPAHIPSLNLLGIICLRQRRFAQALDWFGRAAQLQPNDAGFHFNMGMAQQALGGNADAAASYQCAIALKPDYVDAHSNLGALLLELKRYDEAIAVLDHAIALKPDFAPAHLNRAIALKAAARFEPAVLGYNRAIALNPQYAKAHSSLGNALHEMNRFEEAVACFDRAIAIQPDFAEARWNKGLVLLSNGQFEEGWRLFESRFQCEGFPGQRRNFSQPQWTGLDSLRDKTILLHSEQGMGDTIQFCRYARLVADRGARVLLEVEEPLLGLLQTLDGPAQVIAKGSALPDFDFHCPLLSLPFAFQTRLESIPSRTPYLQSDATRLAAWNQRLGDRKPRIGLAWSGNAAHRNDHNRSVKLAELAPFLSPRFQFVSLQKEVRDVDRAALTQHDNVLHFGEELTDFSDTAALCALMDVVISVDTSVAHLSGALGVPTWVMLPFSADWRWLRDRTDSPWYPGMRLYRQPATADWQAVFSKLASDLSGIGR